MDKINIILLTWNHLEETKKCINSVKLNTTIPYHLIIIDNASTDGTQEYLKQLESIPLSNDNSLEVIYNSENLGFAKANNIGLNKTTLWDRHAVLINNDIEVPLGWLKSLVDTFDKDRKIGIVGPLSTAPTQEQFVERFKDHMGDIVQSHRVAFFCTLIHKQVLQEVGLLDEQFEVGTCEDDDYCIRAKKNDWLIVINTHVLVDHKHHTSLNDTDIPGFTEIHNENFKKLTDKYKQNDKPKEKGGLFLQVLNQGRINVQLANYLIQVPYMAGKTPLKISYPNARPIQHNRNNIVLNFLKTDYTYLCMIDNDIVPHGNIFDVLPLDLDIIGLPCPQWKEDNLMWLVMKYIEEEKGFKQMDVNNKRGIIETDAVGTGAILIHRRVLEHPEMKAPFNRSWTEDGLQNIGLDFLFCMRAKKLGFKVFAHLDFVCSNFVTVDLLKINNLLGQVKKEVVQ